MFSKLLLGISVVLVSAGASFAQGQVSDDPMAQIERMGNLELKVTPDGGDAIAELRTFLTTRSGGIVAGRGRQGARRLTGVRQV